jgi:hypothetical protein
LSAKGLEDSAGFISSPNKIPLYARLIVTGSGESGEDSSEGLGIWIVDLTTEDFPLL